MKAKLFLLLFMGIALNSLNVNAEETNESTNTIIEKEQTLESETSAHDLDLVDGINPFWDSRDRG